MSYIKITNTADNVSRIALEKLGLSTKRNDPNTIGMFGSGIKFAPIAALRNGWEWIFVGKDTDGPYRLSYCSEMEHGVECVVYDYGHYTKPSSFTVDAGGLSWVDAFQIYREAIANAMDGAQQSGGSWSVSIVNHVYDHEDGEFSVYITAAPELVNIMNQSEKYFCENRDVVQHQNGVKTLIKIDDALRVYSHGILVHTNEEVESIYDYDITPIELNEERTIKSDWTMRYEVFKSIIWGKRTVVESVIKALVTNRKCFEVDVFCYNSHQGMNTTLPWPDIFADMYGASAIIVPESIYDSMSYEAKLRGKTPICVSNETYTHLLKVNIPSALSSFGDGVNYKIEKEIENYPLLVRAIKIVESFDSRFTLYKDRTFVFDDPSSSVLGVTIDMEKSEAERTILIEKAHAQSAPIVQLVATLIHEFDHAFTGLKDATTQDGRLFRDLADRRTGELVYDMYGKNPFRVQNGFLVFDPEMAGLVGMRAQISYNGILNRTILRSSKITALVECDYILTDGETVTAELEEFGDEELFAFKKLTNVRSVKVV